MKLRLTFLLGVLALAFVISTVYAQEVGVSPDPLPAINEGEKVAFNITVKNVGTEGTISASVSSISYSFTPLTQTSRDFEAGETFTFKWEAYALNVERDTETITHILVQGRGGTQTYVLKGEILATETSSQTFQLWTYLAIAISLIIGASIAIIIWKRKK